MTRISTRWSISPEDLEACSQTPSLRSSFIDRLIAAEARYLDDCIRYALGMWVSELEPELMFRNGEARPFGITAVGHRTPYILLKWDDTIPLGDPWRGDR